MFDPVSVFLHPHKRPSVIDTMENQLQQKTIGANVKETKDVLKDKSVIFGEERNVNDVVTCKARDNNWPKDTKKTRLKSEAIDGEGTVVPPGRINTDISQNRLNTSAIRNANPGIDRSDSPTKTSSDNSNSCIQNKLASTRKVAPKIVIRRKKRRLENTAEGDSTPRTHKHMKRSKLAVCKVTENGQVKLIISNPRTDSVKRKLLDNDESTSEASCSKSPRIQSHQKEDGNVLEKYSTASAVSDNNKDNSLIDTKKTEHLSAVAAAGIACITSVSFSNSSSPSTTASLLNAVSFSGKTTEVGEAWKNILQQNCIRRDIINQKERSKGSQPCKSNPNETTSLCNKLKPLNQYPERLSSAGNQLTKCSETQPNDMQTTSSAGAEATKHSERTCANSNNEDKCIVSEISIKRRDKKGKAMEHLASLSFLNASAVKLEKDALMTPSESLQASSSAEQISSAVSPPISSHNTFSSPLHLKTDLSKTLFERILDEFSPKKEMKETPLAVACEKISRISDDDKNECKENPTAFTKDEAFTHAKLNSLNNTYSKETVDTNKRNSVARGLFTKAKMSDSRDHSSVKSDCEVKKEQLDMKRANSSNFHSNGENEGMAVLKNNNTAAAAIATGYLGQMEDEKSAQRTSDDNEIERLNAFNVTRPVAVIADWNSALRGEPEVILKPTSSCLCVENNNSSEKQQRQADNGTHSDVPSDTTEHKRSSSTGVVKGKTDERMSERLLLSPGNKTFGDKEYSSSSNLPGLSTESQAPLKINVRWDSKEQVYVRQSPPEDMDTGNERIKHNVEGKQGKGVMVVAACSNELEDTECSSDLSDLGGEEGALIIDERTESNSSVTRESCDKTCDRESIADNNKTNSSPDCTTSTSLAQGEEKETRVSCYKERELGEGCVQVSRDNEDRTVTTGEKQQMDRVLKLNNNGESISGLCHADNEGINAAGENELSGPNGTIPLSERTLCADQCQRNELADSQSKGTTLPITAATSVSAIAADSLTDPSLAEGLLNDTHSGHTDSPPHAKIKRITETKRIGNSCHGNLKVVFSLIPKQPKNAESTSAKVAPSGSADTLPEKNEAENDKVTEQNQAPETKAENTAVVLKTPSVPKQITSKALGKKVKRRQFTSVFGLNNSALPSCPSVNVTPLGMFASPRVQTVSTPCEVSTPTPSSCTSSESLTSDVYSFTDKSYSETPVTSRKASIELHPSHSNEEKNVSSVSKVLLSVPDCSRLKPSSRSASVLSVPSSSLCVKSEQKSNSLKNVTLAKVVERVKTSTENKVNTPKPNSATEYELKSSALECDKSKTGAETGKSVGSALFTSPIDHEKKHSTVNICVNRIDENNVKSADTLCPQSEHMAKEPKSVDIIKRNSSFTKSTENNRLMSDLSGTNDRVSKTITCTTNASKTLPSFRSEKLKVPQSLSSSSSAFTQGNVKSLSVLSMPKDTSVSIDTPTGSEKPAKKTAGYMVKPKQLFEAMRSRQLKQQTNSLESRPAVLPFPGRQKRPDFHPIPKHFESDNRLKSNAGTDSFNRTNLHTLSETRNNSDENQSKPVAVSKLKTISEVNRLADPASSEVVSLGRNPVLPRNATTPPLMVTPSFYGAPFLPFAPHFTGTYIHPILPLMMGLDRAADDLYLQRTPLYDHGHVTNLLDRYYAAHSPSIFPIGCLEEGPSHASRIDVPLDFSTRGSNANGSGESKLKTSIKESHLELKK